MTFDPKTSCGKDCNCESYRAHLLSISVSAQATPTRDRSKETNAAVQTEKQWDKDMPAYERLRKEGMQPPHIDGSAHIESSATDKLEVEAGKTLGKHLGNVKELKQGLQEMGGN